MKKIFALFTILAVLALTGCSAIGDEIKDFSSDINGLDRICTIRYIDGTTEVLEGMIRIDPSDTGASLIHLTVDNKRYSFFETSVSCVEK